MDVRLDEARDHQAAVELFLRRVGRDVRLDRGDAAAADPDVDQRVRLVRQCARWRRTRSSGIGAYCAASARPR